MRIRVYGGNDHHSFFCGFIPSHQRVGVMNTLVAVVFFEGSLLKPNTKG